MFIAVEGRGEANDSSVSFLDELGGLLNGIIDRPLVELLSTRGGELFETPFVSLAGLNRLSFRVKDRPRSLVTPVLPSTLLVETLL